MAQKKALGRGLSALLGTPDLDTDQLREIDVDRILPNSHQPRKNFDEEAHANLSLSHQVQQAQTRPVRERSKKQCHIEA